MARKREAAIAAAERACPRCGTPRRASRTTASSCGLRLPASPAGSRRCARLDPPVRLVSRRLDLGRPADAARRDRGRGARSRSPTRARVNGGTTIVASANRLPRRATQPVPPGAAALPDRARADRDRTTPRPRRRRRAIGPNGRVSWPATRDGWTIVLVSYPFARGRAPRCDRARAAGLGFRGSACSSRRDFSSLHPGYAIVFSGVYSSRADAEAALTSARATGFGTAYTREISRSVRQEHS